MSKLYRGKLQKKKKKKKGPLIIFLLLSFILLFFIFKGLTYGISTIGDLSLFKIKEIHIISPSNINKKDILTLSGIKKGDNIFSISVKKSIKNVKKHKWVKSINIKRSFPNSIEITINSKNAVALVKKDNKLYYIDQKGMVIDKFIPGYKNNLVIMNSESEVYTGNLKLYELIAAIENPRIYIKTNIISEIITETDNIYTLLLTGLDFKILVKPDNIENNLIRIQKVIADMKKRNEKIAVIDATLSDNRIVVRRK